jgi:hypothetical protein
MKIDAQKTLTNMRGDPFKVVEKTEAGETSHIATVGEYLADILGMDKTPHFRPMKAYELGRKFGTQETVEIDNSDWTDLKAVLDESQRPPVIVGQIREYFAELDQQAAKQKNEKVK